MRRRSPHRAGTGRGGQQALEDEGDDTRGDRDGALGRGGLGRVHALLREKQHREHHQSAMWWCQAGQPRVW